MLLRLLHWGLRHRRGRHALNVIVIASTVAVVSVFAAVIQEISTFTVRTDLVRHLLQPKLVYGDHLPPSIGSLLQEIPGVKTTERFVTADIAIGDDIIAFEGNGPAWSTTPDPMFPVEPAVLKAWQADKMGAIFGSVPAMKLGVRVGQLVEIPTPKGPMQLRVIGISDQAKNWMVVVHYDYLREILKPESEGFRAYTAPEDSARFMREVDERTKDSPNPAFAQSDVQMMQMIVRKVSMITVVFGFLGIFLLCTTIMTLANHAAIMVRERRIEMATLRVIGFKRRTIVALVLFEVIAIGLIAVAIAMLALKGAFPSGVQLTPEETDLLHSVQVGPLPIVCGVLTGILTPLLGAIPAAVNAFRKPLVEALRDAA